MTLYAQQSMIFGSMCIDEAFRNDLFAAPDPGTAETYEGKVARLLRDYGATNNIAVDNAVVDNVLNVVRGPCRVAAQNAFAAAKNAACPCWPC